MSSAAIVLDANIVIYSVLGTRVRDLIQTQAANVLKANKPKPSIIMNAIKKTAVALFFASSNFCVLAQYKFADIDWGTPVDAAKEILEKKGYIFKVGIGEKFECATRPTCVLNFSGPSVLRGRIVFMDKRLTYIGLDTGDRPSALNALTKKYGPPQHDWPPGRDRFLALPQENRGELYWSDWRGSSLSIRLDGYVSYRGEPPKAAADLSGHKNF